MTHEIVVGTSCQLDPRAAAAEAVAQVRSRVHEPALALVLCTDQYDSDALAEAMSAELGDLPWAGCNAAGVLAGDRCLETGVVVGVLCGPGLRARVGFDGGVREDPRQAGRSAVARALASMPRSVPGCRAILLLADVQAGDPAEVVRGAIHEAGAGVRWVGGGAGSNVRHVRAVQFEGGRAHREGVLAVAIDAPRPVGVGAAHGWLPYGPPTMVTEAQHQRVVELDYEAAFEVYGRTAAELGAPVTCDSFVSFAMTHPLGIPQADGAYVIRDPIQLEIDGALRCVGDVPAGCLVRVMRGDAEMLLAAAGEAAAAARAEVAAPIGGALVFDCVSRYLILRERVCEELQRMQSRLGTGVPLMGCLTLGEIGALGHGMPQFHNKTVVLLALPG